MQIYFVMATDLWIPLHYTICLFAKPGTHSSSEHISTTHLHVLTSVLELLWIIMINYSSLLNDFSVRGVKVYCSFSFQQYFLGKTYQVGASGDLCNDIQSNTNGKILWLYVSVWLAPCSTRQGISGWGVQKLTVDSLTVFWSESGSTKAYRREPTSCLFKLGRSAS